MVIASAGQIASHSLQAMQRSSPFRGGLKSVKNLEELFKALDEDEAARPETVSRFEVFEDGKRAYVRSGVAIEVSYLDDDRTLKVFVKARKKAPT